MDSSRPPRPGPPPRWKSIAGYLLFLSGLLGADLATGPWKWTTARGTNSATAFRIYWVNKYIRNGLQPRITHSFDEYDALLGWGTTPNYNAEIAARERA